MHVRLLALLLMLMIGFTLTKATGPGRSALAQDTPKVVQLDEGGEMNFQARVFSKAGAPLNATCSFQFVLYDALTGGNQISHVVNKNDVIVKDGFFAVELNFLALGGNTLFKEEKPRWLEMRRRDNDCTSGGYVTSMPRIPLRYVPYAFRARFVHWDGILGVPPGLTGTKIATNGGLLFTNQNELALDEAKVASLVTANIKVASGGGVLLNGNRELTLDEGKVAGLVTTNIKVAPGGGVLFNDKRELALDENKIASLVNTTVAASTWSLSGNANTNASSLLGTTNNMTLTFVVNNTPALRLAPGNNLIGGSPNNQIAAGVGNNVIAGGSANQITANVSAAVVGGGRDNKAAAAYTTIPGGSGAVATQYGQMAYANGYFANPGDAQTSVYLLRRQTPTMPADSSYLLYLDGESQTLTIPPGKAWVFDILLIGASVTNTYGFTWHGVITNINGTTQLGSRTTWEELGSSPSAGEISVRANDDTDSLDIVIQPMGPSSVLWDTPIRWVATVRTAEVATP